MKNKSYILVLGVLVVIALTTYQLIIPKFSTQEYSRDTVENISKGITTTSIVEVHDSESPKGAYGEKTEIGENTTIDIGINPNAEDELLRFTRADRIEGIFTSYLLIGSDKRSKDSSLSRGFASGQRADVIILGLINNLNNKTSLISIPRDLLIQNSCTKEIQRVNSSFIANDCGNDVENLAASILNLTGININHLALFNFEGFEKIIDSVGGIQLCIDRHVREGYSYELQKGCQIVNGEIALNWVVSRNTEVLIGEKILDDKGEDASTWKKLPSVSDLTRIQRQQDIVIELLSQVKDFASVSALNSFIDALEDTFVIDENLTNSKAAGILWNLRNQNLSDINKLTISTKPYRTQSGMEVLMMTSYFSDFLKKNDLLD